MKLHMKNSVIKSLKIFNKIKRNNKNLSFLPFLRFSIYFIKHVTVKRKSVFHSVIGDVIISTYFWFCLASSLYFISLPNSLSICSSSFHLSSPFLFFFCLSSSLSSISSPLSYYLYLFFHGDRLPPHKT